MPSKTVAMRSSVVIGKGTLVAHSATTPVVSPYSYSLHDTTDPDKAGAHNEIWPRGAGTSVVFNQGLVVHHRDAAITNSVTVTTS
jgi:hypothetical protein